MRLAVHGHPLHSRVLSITLRRRDDGRLDARGELLDLRKRGFVPVAADLQTSGVVHQMSIDAVVDAATAVIESIAAEQPAVAFEAAAVTGGESCRDPIERLQALRGAPLDGEFARRLGAAFGGPRGCSHVLTLAQLLGSTVPRALAHVGENGLSAWRPGERIFRRDVLVDGHEADEGRLQVALQLSDVRFAAAPPIARPMDRFAAQHELRILVETEAYAFPVSAIECAERRRTWADVESAGWSSRNDATAQLIGLPLLSGFQSELLRRFADRAGDRPLLDALLMLAPALIQIIAALSESWPAEGKQSPSLMGTGGLPDSCYMWRREGALSERLKSEIQSGTLPPRRRSD
jgi:hypothetical protein